MDSDFFIDSYFSGINQTLTKQQQDYILALENIFKSNLRDDYGLLVNVYKLYQTCKGSKVIDKNTVSVAHLTNEYRFTELLAKFFGLSERYIYILLQISSKFIDFAAGCKFRIPELNDYSISKLQELLPISIESIKLAFKSNCLTSKSTRAEIRSLVQTMKGGKKDNTVIEDNVQQEEKELSSEDYFNFSITFPLDVYEFIKKQVLVLKKASSLEEYVISLIREQM